MHGFITELSLSLSFLPPLLLSLPSSLPQQISKAIQDSFAKANNIAEEVLSSMRTVRSFANEGAEASHFATKLAHTYRIYIKIAFVYGSWMWTNTVSEGRGWGSGLLFFRSTLTLFVSVPFPLPLPLLPSLSPLPIYSCWSWYCRW